MRVTRREPPSRRRAADADSLAKLPSSFFARLCGINQGVIAGLTKAFSESRRAIDLGYPRGHRGARETEEEDDPHACTAMNRFSSSPAYAVFYVFCIAGGLAVFLIKPPTTLWFSCNYELLRGYIHAP